MTDTYRAVVLASRPTGMPVPSDFAVVERELRAPQDGEVVIQNLYASLDAGKVASRRFGAGRVAAMIDALDRIEPKNAVDDAILDGCTYWTEARSSTTG